MLPSAVTRVGLLATFDSPNERMLLQELNLTTRQPHRAQHHVIQATMSEGLAQGSYVVARVGFEPATLQTKGNELTIEPPRPLKHELAYN